MLRLHHRTLHHHHSLYSQKNMFDQKIVFKISSLLETAPKKELIILMLLEQLAWK